VGSLAPADRVIALLEWGDVAEADAAIAATEAAEPGGWQTSLWRGTRALMEGRFEACERLAAEATRRGQGLGHDRASVFGTMLLVALRREQERPAEAEAILRSMLEHHPAAPAGAHAMLAVLMGDMGRDSQARQELARLVPWAPAPVTGRLAALCMLAELAAKLQAEDVISVLSERLALHARDFAVEEGGSAFYGSVSLALGRLAFAGGRWNDAEVHLGEAADAHARVGTPLLLAHAQRELAAVLRARGEPHDWERAVQLLGSAVAIYRQLGVDRLAAETQEVLARSEDGLGVPDVPAGAQAIFQQLGDTWLVGTEAGSVRLRDTRGLHDIARLLAAPRRPIHVADLLAEPARLAEAVAAAPKAAGQTGAGADGRLRRRRSASAPLWTVPQPVVDEDTRVEYVSRQCELAGELVEAERAGDAVRVALARAERDSLTSALRGSDADDDDPLDRARRAVGARIRISLDRIERAQPPIGRHLRTSIRTGTFCTYVPDRPVRWRL
jgi:tetratricopeptide (TPR) repeat protein